MTSSKAKTIKFWMVILVVITVVITGIAIMIKYEIEGEKKMPYNISKITMICTAEGIESEAKTDVSKEKWNLKILQTNDIYISIDKNKKYAKDELLSKVIIENVQITQTPNIGEIKAYMPNSLDGRIYSYIDDYLIDQKLEYRGGQKSNPKTLEIGAQGGMAYVSFVNTGIGQYSSNTEEEIIHNGKLIGLINNIKEEDLKFKVKFDLIIEINETKYKTSVDLGLPCGEIISNGTATLEMTDFSNLVFKRIR